MAHHKQRPRPAVLGLVLRAAVVLALAGSAVFAGPSAMACGCGGVVAEPGTQTSVDREVALLTHNGSTESITMQLSMDSTAEDLGLLVPTPTPATVTLGERTTFDDLSTAVRPRPVQEFHLFGPPALFAGGNESSSGASSAAAGTGVTALSTVDLGPLQATTLRADDPAALRAWLAEHDYQIRDGLQAQLTPYIDEGWTFVAVRLTQQGKALQGDLPPIVMSFESSTLIYPMRMSRAATAAESVRTYVLGEHRVQRDDATAAVGSPHVVFAGPVDPADLADMTSTALTSALATAPYLTVVDQYFARPSENIVSDFTFTTAPTDEQVIPTYTVDTYGIPVDIAILLLLVLIGLVVAGWRLIARRRRPPAGG